MALALNLIAGQDEPYIKGTKSMFDLGAEREKTTTELKSNRLALADLERKDEQQKRITARLPELMAAAKDGKLQQDQLYDLAQANPQFVQNYIAQRKYDAEVALRNRNDMKNFLTGILPYVNSATTAGQDPKMRWEQAQALAKANGVSLGNLEGLPWDNNTESALRMQINALGGLDKPDLESVPGMVGTKDENGQMKYQALPKEEKTKAVPVVGKNGLPVERTIPLGNGKIMKERQMTDGTWEKLGESTQKEAKEAEEPVPPLTPDAIAAAAERYLIDGTLPPMGMGKGGATGRALILNKAAAMAKERGQGGAAQRIGQLSNKANASALLQLQKQTTMVAAFEEMANKNADIALEMSAKVGRTGVPVVNRWILAGRNKIAGDPDVATFNTAVNVFMNEYAKIMSGSMGNTPVSDSARKEAAHILNTAQTPEQLQANIRLLQREMKNRIKGLHEQRQMLLGQMQGEAPAQAAPQRPAAGNAPVQIRSAADYHALPPGSAYIDPNGIRRKKP